MYMWDVIQTTQLKQPQLAAHVSELIYLDLCIRDFLGPRVSCIINLRQALEVKRGVDLGGGDRCMPQQFLYCAQIAGALQHVRGE